MTSLGDRSKNRSRRLIAQGPLSQKTPTLEVWSRLVWDRGLTGRLQMASRDSIMPTEQERRQ